MPSLPLRSYLEYVKDLTLNQLKSILRSHYREKQGAELYQMLATLSQSPGEDPRSFLLRGMNIRQKLILQGSQEDPYNLTYNPEHVQMFFLKSLKTAFQSERITNFMKPRLENLSISDENLILHLNEAISEEEERQAKLAFQKKSKTVVNEVSKANCDEEKGKTDQNPKSASKNPLLAAVEGLQAQVAEIGGTVKLLQEKVDRSQLEQPADHTQQQVRSERGNKSFRKRAQEKQMKPGCESCKSKSIGDQCKHCWSCGGDNHISRHCSRNPRNQKGNYRGLQPRDREWPVKLKLGPTIVMAVVNQNMIKTFYSVSSVNRLDIVLISVKRKAGILIRSYVRLFMSYPSQVNLKVRVTVRTIRSMLVT